MDTDFCFQLSKFQLFKKLTLPDFLSASNGDLSRLGNDERNLPKAKAREGRASGRERVIGIKGEVSKLKSDQCQFVQFVSH
jgi:hypothetical protein